MMERFRTGFDKNLAKGMILITEFDNFFNLFVHIYILLVSFFSSQ